MPTHVIPPESHFLIGSRAATRLSRARSLIAEERRDAAVALLRRGLSGRNPYTAPVNTTVRDLAELYVGLTVSDPAEAATVGWAVYLPRAALDLDNGVQEATRLLIELARRRGTRASSAGSLTSPADRVGNGLRSGRTVACRFATASFLHEYGLCGAAERETLAALCRWASHHENAPDVTYTLLVEALALLELCGRTRQGVSLLNAYAALLPATGSDGDVFLRDYAERRLGDRRARHRHQEVCGVRGTGGNFRTALLGSLAYRDEEPAEMRHRLRTSA